MFILHTFFLKFIILYAMKQLLSTFMLSAQNPLFGVSSASSSKFFGSQAEEQDYKYKLLHNPGVIHKTLEEHKQMGQSAQRAPITE